MDRVLARLWAYVASTLILIAAFVASFILAFPGHAQGTVTVLLGPANTMGEFVAAVQSVVNEYPTDPFTITAGRYDPTGKPFTEERYVGAMPGILIINDKYVANPELIESDFAYDVENDYHSPGCSAQTYLGFHEAAHQIDYTHNMRARQAAWDWAGTVPQETAYQLSGYSFDDAGRFSPAEALAEAFASVKCDPAASTPAEHTLFEILVNTK
jgi:hypothetical protein